MGLFKSKKSSPSAVPKGGQEDGSSIPTNNVGTKGKQRKKKKFSLLKKNKPQQQVAADKTIEPAEEEQQQQRDNHKETLEEDDDIGDIPRSISTPSRDGGELLPPLPKDGQNRDGDHGDEGKGEEEDDQDSIGSPCEAMLKKQQTADDAKNHERASKLQTITAEQPPSMDNLLHYIAALSPSVSPDPSADLPSRALRCLFSLSEHSSHKQQRIDMVRGDYGPPPDDVDGAVEEGEANGGDGSLSLVPALLSFLKRCPRDSSEQYLTLLVINNLSIPTQNKRLIGLEFGGAKTLGRLLCEDPGCHLLVIIIVNLTFGDDKLNRDLLTMSGTSSQRVRSEDSRRQQSFVSCGGDVQLVDSLSYALLLASLTTTQLSTLGPIPLASPEGTPHTPRKLLSLLFSLLESKLGIRYRRNGNAASPANEEEDAPSLSLGGDDCPFPETARWCLSALKNLTRPGKLSPSSVGVANDKAGTVATAENNNDEELNLSEEIGLLANRDASAVAAHAILDAGILPLLLRILKHKVNGAAESIEDTMGGVSFYSWQSNTAQDAALYTLMHMASVPQIRRTLREDFGGCVEALVSILNYGKVISEKLENAAISGGGNEEDEEMGRTSLQCLKARITLSYLVLGSGDNANSSKYGSAMILGDHEIHAFVDLLSHCVQGRAKEGSGAYSAATFSLKGVLHAINCILSEPRNRELFASSNLNESRMNTLLLKAVAQYSLLDEEITEATLDAEAVEHAVVSMYWMTLYGLDETVTGFPSPLGRGTFLPAFFGDGKAEAKSFVVKVFAAYLGKDEITSIGRHAANQILFRINYLLLDGWLNDLAYPGKNLPSKSDFDMDEKLLAAIKVVSGEEMRIEGAKPKEYIFDRAISRNEKDGPGSKTFSSGEGAPSKTFASPLIAAEELVVEQPTLPIDTIAVANNIAYYADGLDIYYGYIWKWEDGRGDSIERVYSAAATEDQMLTPEEMTDSTGRSEPYSPPRKGFLGRIKLPAPAKDDNEPFSIFGFRCGAHMCGSRGH
mmetsp:Transcript_41622/g.88689  ORF Transcript_41622/g.88689 Transcript_41622/m.88689 type:complete len:1018 (+) Transcript_41622:150-3203(+)